MKHGLPKLLALLAADFIAFTAAFAPVLIGYSRKQPCRQAVNFTLAILFFFAISSLMGLYRQTWAHTKPELDSVGEIRAQFLTTVVSFLLTFTARDLFRFADASPVAAIIISYLLLPFTLILSRHLIRSIFHIPKKRLVVNGEIAIPVNNRHNYGLALPFPKFFKFLLEKLLAALLIILFLPLTLLLILLVRLTSPGKAFYTSSRFGFKGRKFKIYKFRTMYQDAVKRLNHLIATNPAYAQQWQTKHKLDFDPRVTPVGRFLRKTSLDELPQLWNIFIGDMAFIGPRPVDVIEADSYQPGLEEMLTVKPGLTGLWQVCGRHDLTNPQRVNLNLFYIRHWSIWLDLYILLKTVPEVLSAHGK